MAELVAGIHVFLAKPRKPDLDGRNKPGYDAESVIRPDRNPV
jgi:hypothetical protein